MKKFSFKYTSKIITLSSLNISQNTMRPSTKRRKEQRRQVGQIERRKKEQQEKIAVRLEVRAAIGATVPTLETTNPEWTIEYDERI